MMILLSWALSTFVAGEESPVYKNAIVDGGEQRIYREQRNYREDEVLRTEVKLKVEKRSDDKVDLRVTLVTNGKNSTEQLSFICPRLERVPLGCENIKSYKLIDGNRIELPDKEKTCDKHHYVETKEFIDKETSQEKYMNCGGEFMLKKINGNAMSIEELKDMSDKDVEKLKIERILFIINTKPKNGKLAEGIEMQIFNEEGNFYITGDEKTNAKRLGEESQSRRRLQGMYPFKCREGQPMLTVKIGLYVDQPFCQGREDECEEVAAIIMKEVSRVFEAQLQMTFEIADFVIVDWECDFSFGMDSYQQKLDQLNHPDNRALYMYWTSCLKTRTCCKTRLDCKRIAWGVAMIAGLVYPDRSAPLGSALPKGPPAPEKEKFCTLPPPPPPGFRPPTPPPCQRVEPYPIDANLPRSAIVRMWEDNDLQTIVHELGHSVGFYHRFGAQNKEDGKEHIKHGYMDYFSTLNHALNDPELHQEDLQYNGKEMFSPRSDGEAIPKYPDTQLDPLIGCIKEDVCFVVNKAQEMASDPRYASRFALSGGANRGAGGITDETPNKEVGKSRKRRGAGEEEGDVGEEKQGGEDDGDGLTEGKEREVDENRIGDQATKPPRPTKPQPTNPVGRKSTSPAPKPANAGSNATNPAPKATNPASGGECSTWCNKGSDSWDLCGATLGGQAAMAMDYCKDAHYVAQCKGTCCTLCQSQ